MKHIISLIRYKNVAFVGLTMYLIRYCVLKPVIDYSPYKPMLDIDLSFQLSDGLFFMLVLSTMMITAAGYAINDYFDRKTDLVNRPSKVIVSTHVSRRSAIVLHWIFSVIGIALGYWVSIAIGKFNLGMIFVIASGSLWFYSSNFSSQLIVGNILVALLVAIVPMLVFVFDMIPLIEHYGGTLNKLFINQMLFWVLGFAYFAFLTNFIREIVKDMEDLEGDNAYGRNTLPIVLGMKNAKMVVMALIAVLLFSAVFALLVYLPSMIDWIYFIGLIISPALFLAYVIFKADSKKNYTKASKLLKLMMFTGVMYSVVHYFQYI